jgi:NAD(P)-dependent dehydrogenase (short-subunit alcohol dehydrogenase family)
MQHEPTRIVLVTGASRGVGAEVAAQLADRDTHVIVNYRENTHRAEAVAAAIRHAGGHASTLGADIAEETATAAMFDSIAARFGRLDTVILNAAGGPELGTDPGYALHLNRDAQRRLALLAVPLMPVGGRIVFVTSHQAHFFPAKAVPKGYAPVAASRRAGETALYAKRMEFARAGIQLTVVSGNITDEAGATAPAVQEMAAAIVRSATTPSPSGVVYVGRADYLMTA